MSLEANPGRQRRQTWGLKNEEFMADFVLVSRRTLDEEQYKIFKFHFLLGGDWKLCCRKLAMDRGSFFHEVYRIEQKLGRTFRELEPFALYPLDEYFNSTIRRARTSEVTTFAVESEGDEQTAGKELKGARVLSRFPTKIAA